VTPEEQALVRALVLEVKFLRRDVADALERVKLMDNLQALQSQAIHRLNERMLYVDVSDAFEEFEDGIPQAKLN
jgi:hypothetical protein